MSQEPERKIVIDEDWKAQVEREREELRKKEAAAAATPTGPTADEADNAQRPPVALPPPDLLYIGGTLYMQALVAMGMVKNPISGKVEKQLDLARHAIDTLAVLQQKTEGNRTAEETEAFETMLHDLRMAFVSAAT